MLTDKMFGVFPGWSLVLVVFFAKLTVGDQKSDIYANCRLTNTCFGRTTEDLVSEGSITPKIIDEDFTLSTQTTSNPILNTDTSSDNALYANTTLHTETAITENTNGNSESPSITGASTIVQTPDDPYTIKLVTAFEPYYCELYGVVMMNDFIYTLCEMPSNNYTLRAYDAGTPHDLQTVLLISFDNAYQRMRMIGYEKQNTLYVEDWSWYTDEWSIWKIDIYKNKVSKWLWGSDLDVRISVANDDHLLVFRYSEDYLFFEIYDQDARLISNMSLSNDFNLAVHRTFSATQKPDGGFIVTHAISGCNFIGCNCLCASFISVDACVRPKKTICFTEVQLLRVTRNNTEFLLRVELFSGNAYGYDWNTKTWNLTDLIVITSNSTEGRSEFIVDVRSTDGRSLNHAWIPMQGYAWLFWDADDDNLVAVECNLGNVYLFDKKSLHWNKLRRLRNSLVSCDSGYGIFQYESNKKRMIAWGQVKILFVELIKH